MNSHPFKQTFWFAASAAILFALPGCDRERDNLSRIWMDESAAPEHVYLHHDLTYDFRTIYDKQTWEEGGHWKPIKGNKFHLEPDLKKYPQASPQDVPYTLAPDGRRMNADFYGKGPVKLQNESAVILP